MTELGINAARHLGASSGSASRTHIARAVLARLDTLDPVVDGVGVIAEVGVVPEHLYWMEWWQRAEDGSLYWMEWWQRAEDGSLAPDHHHVIDPDREDFYDYSSKEFMAKPRQLGKPWATGPYVDHGGVDDYSVTIAVPTSGTQGNFLVPRI